MVPEGNSNPMNPPKNKKKLKKHSKPLYLFHISTYIDERIIYETCIFIHLKKEKRKNKKK